jgi:hypothetical protein
MLFFKGMQTRSPRPLGTVMGLPQYLAWSDMHALGVPVA